MNVRYAALPAVKASVLLMLASTLAAGCSSGEHAVRETPAGPVKSAAAMPDAAKVVANSLPKKIANEPGVRRNVIQTACAAVPGGWGAEGTARNPGEKPVTYKIVVFFTTTKATTLDYAQTLAKVPPGKTVNWSVKKEFKAERKMLCPMPGISVVA
ncbi:hypothetical protein [Microbispora sp. NPDC049125]|uniref:hypothetical protein n=1 Tax=Microbispora sp. NPDC049125 TaxID=3154929 RepID=UPI003466D922